MRKMISRLSTVFRRINQVVLVFPVWLVVGLSGVFRSFDQEGWIESDNEENYRRMF